ncbi:MULTISPECIES: chaplin [unclassified Streptomyces]|uniref:chaplin n=1 Tax=unclassified Streptomyces TaxID=2593676 RepID=UPI0037F4213C
MNRIVRTVAMGAASCAMVVGAAGIATASDGGHHHKKGAHAKASASRSPGVLSGNVIQIPIHVPVNVCGNSVNLLALLNPAFGNKCTNR